MLGPASVVQTLLCGSFQGGHQPALTGRMSPSSCTFQLSTGRIRCLSALPPSRWWGLAAQTPAISSSPRATQLVWDTTLAVPGLGHMWLVPIWLGLWKTTNISFRRHPRNQTTCFRAECPLEDLCPGALGGHRIPCSP